MNYAAEMDAVATIHLPNPIKNSSGIQKIIKGEHSRTDAERA
jgi:hypothetical protein